MDFTWTAYLRDIFIILAAAALILVCLYFAFVTWQVHKMARALSVDLAPVIESAQHSARTVESTAGFVANRFTTPANAATSTALGMYGLWQLYRHGQAAPPEPIASPTAAPSPTSGEA
jgi:hypothetical protein